MVASLRGFARTRGAAWSRAAVALVSAGLLSGLVVAPVGAASYTIVMDNVQFTPSPLRVRVGDTITWSNRDIIPHQVVPDAGGFTKTPIIQPGKSYRTTITKAGTINYHDSLNSIMRGTLIVAAGPTPRPTPKPTPRATPRPTPKPTPKPTPRATATAAPAATLVASAEPSPSVAPASSDTAGTSSDPGNGGSSGGTGSSAPEPAADPKGQSGLGDVGIVALVLLIGVLAFLGGGAYQAFRRDRTG